MTQTGSLQRLYCGFIFVHLHALLEFQMNQLTADVVELMAYMSYATSEHH